VNTFDSKTTQCEGNISALSKAIDIAANVLLHKKTTQELVDLREEWQRHHLENLKREEKKEKEREKLKLRM
jgi:hypothetical protein